MKGIANVVKINKVYLIGSGPGDPGLLTLKAKELIEQADVIIYDNLVDTAILRFCKDNCEKIYVGKSGSHHTLVQDEINELLVRKAKEYPSVVRLKGGDPFIFGRGGEEALILQEHNISFEIVPGISSAYAVPAYAGIPVTHRGVASSVAFITGHEDPTKDSSHIHWEKLATGTQTLVFLMGVKNLPLIVGKLIECGRAETTAAAIVNHGTYAYQKTVIGTLKDIVAKAREENIKPPSIIIIGDVVNLRSELNWFETKPLFGKRIIVTRARAQSSDLVKRLQNLGAHVIELPTIKITKVDHEQDIIENLKRIEKYNWIIFTSVNGVKYFFHYLHNLKLDSRHVYSNKFCVIGAATKDALEAFGIIPDLMPTTYDSKSVVELLAAQSEIDEQSFLLPRASIAPSYLPDSLKEMGAKSVTDLSIYKTIEESLDTDSSEAELVQNGDFDLVTFTSSSTVKNFVTLLQSLGVTDFSKIQSASIGPLTAETAIKCGFNNIMQAKEYTIDGLVDAILGNE